MNKKLHKIARIVFSLAIFCSGESALAQSNYTVFSPDQRIEVRIRTADRLSYDVLLNGSLLLQNSTLSININHVNLGAQPKVKAAKQRTENNEIVCPVPQKSGRIREHYNELKLELEGDYVCIARRKDREWYIGGMTDWTSRTLDIDLSFLPSGRFQMVAYEDGPNADRMGNDYKVTIKDIDGSKKLKINLASGGGWAARIYPKGKT